MANKKATQDWDARKNFLGLSIFRRLRKNNPPLYAGGCNSSRKQKTICYGKREGVFPNA
jgi:hypothetical protein